MKRSRSLVTLLVILGAGTGALPGRAQSPSEADHRTSVASLPTANWSLTENSKANPDATANPLSTRHTRWQLSDNDCKFRCVSHRRHSTETNQPVCDRLRIVSGEGTHAYVACATQPLSVIEELELSVPFLADRAGQQVITRVVLPRSIHPKTGQPLTILVHGDVYDTPGKWQTLRLPKLTELLERQVRVLRAQYGPDVDGREAFVDHLLMNLYTSAGTTLVQLGDPVIQGAVVHGRTQLPLGIHDKLAASVRPASAAVPLGQPIHKATFRLEGDLLLVDGRPFFVRGIQSQGEDWEFLQRLGFNTLQLRTPVTGEQIQEAERLGLWLIAPPPLGWRGGDLSQPYRRVIAWNLGDGLTSHHLDAKRSQAEATRAADSATRRPILCNPDTDLALYDEFVDIMVHRREPIGSGFRLPHYRGWLATRSELSLAGTPHWAMIQTEPLPSVLTQAVAFGYPRSEPSRMGASEVILITAEEIESLALSAVATGMRGLVFASRSRLDADSHAARARAAALRALNLKLDTIEPWIAGGHIAARGIGDDLSSPTTVLRTARSWLVLPAPASHHDYAELTIPGIPAAIDVFEFQPSGLGRLSHERTAGGVRLSHDQRQNRMLLLTRDQLVVRHINRKLKEHAPVAAELQRQVAEDLFQRTVRLLEQLERSTEWLDPAADSLGQSHDFVKAGRYNEAQSKTIEALDIIQSVRERVHSQTVVKHSPIRLPWDSHVEALVWQPFDNLQKTSPNELAAWKFGEELLPTGDFEDLAAMRDAGWRNWEHRSPNVTTEVELTADTPRRGTRCLRLKAFHGSSDHAAAEIGRPGKGFHEKPPLWITSPPMTFAPGTQLVIRGWVRMTDRPTRCHDGALLFDSLGGPSLGVRIDPAPDWQPFWLLRAVDDSGQLSMTLALTGIGQVDLDGLSIVEVNGRKP